MRRNKVKKENPPARLLGTMILLVLGLVVAYATLALGILFLVRRLVHLEDASYTLLWPILILSVSAILGVLLAIFIFRGYLAPLSRLMKATKAVAAGDYSVPGARWRRTSTASTKWRRSWPVWSCCGRTS